MYKLGEIINNRKIIDIHKKIYIRSTVYYYTVECLNCHKTVVMTKYQLDNCNKNGCRSCDRKYKIGEVINGREIIGYDSVKEGKRIRYKYKFKCIKCGTISSLCYRDVIEHKCNTCKAPEIGNTHILSETPRRGRKLDLPKNITYSKKGYYEVCVCAGGKNKPSSVRWRKRFNNIDDCLKILPVFKQLALYYKKTGEYISYDELTPNLVLFHK